ncbi:homeobox protein cut [Nilaparvata lugens]|uniref:homeobox protein cut n=1 Tax=Nilaparvata lugens TaxID=108931 RepID=UPI00193D8135|nr:homeobox protein cut [Nilaparvata lugens]
MDIQAMQSMDWLFKKERIYLLAQFWQQRATLAEKEVSALKEQLSVANQSSLPDSKMAATATPGEEASRSSIQVELSAKDKEISQLVEDVQRLQSSIGKLQENSSNQIARLEEELEHKRQHICRLEARLEAQRDYDELKRQVSILRSIELSRGVDGGKCFETLLFERRRTLRVVYWCTGGGGGAKQQPPPPPPPQQQHKEEEQPAEAERMNGGACSPAGDSDVVCTGPQLVNGLNNNVLPLGAAPLGFPDVIKSPFRFDDRSPFRFSDDPGAIVGRFGESLIPKGDPMEARLQEMLRYNMDKYSTQNLDTLHIARRVRELLSIHNVGQRLFAKYVLGLSQGTVSELLSKPKPWDKLTEKGRDSYRKMHAWASDENAVLLLKSLIPKKGKDTGAGIASVFSRGDPDITEERIAHILNEASQLMKPQPQGHDDSRSNDDSKSPNHGQVNKSFSPIIIQLIFPHFFGAAAAAAGGEDLRVALDTYHRELAKLNAQVGCTGVANTGLFALQQQALNQPNPHNGMAQDLSLPKIEKKTDQPGKLPNGDIVSGEQAPLKKEGAPDSVADVLRHSGSAFSLVRPKTEPGMGHVSAGSSASSPLGNSILPPEDFSPSAAVSPLQRMASITNALISQPSTPHHHSPSQRPLKAVLPPITQQQFDQFNNLNTEEIVRKVKEQLSQFSISQRLFGESVLGLSQGSVSDLLARPKPWHMLTQKGREPFIRMKMFLEDDNAVHKLVASQYKIAPEKLMRTGGYGVSTSAAVSKPLPPSSGKMPPMPPNLDMNKIDGSAIGALNYLHPPPPTSLHSSSPHHMPPTTQAALDQIKKSHSISLPQQCATLQQHQQQQQQQQQNQHQNQTQHPLPPQAQPQQPQSQHPTQPNQHQNQQPPNANQQLGPQQQNSQQQQMPQQPGQQQHMRALNQHVAPTVYEMAALTQDLDTQFITTKIKEVLLANNIGQKIFGEAVLGLSQGSVSELLSKPKPWHMLSIKGREPFIRMQLWLTDTNNIDRLQAIKTERRELNKRRRGSGQQDNSSDTSSNDTSEFYHCSANSPPSAKKQRVLFSEEQKEALRLAFTLDPYPSLATTEFLANELTLSSRTITNWFHNHRMRLKQQSPHGSDSGQSNRENQGSGFDPVQFRMLLSQRLGLGSLPGLPFPPPYFPPNPELAALISRGMLPLQEQDAGLDLSVKHEGTDYEDNDSRLDSEESDSGTPDLTPCQVPEPRTNRRKPAAPQWVNPDWQEEPEVIINGVCVMQTDDYNERERVSETVRVEPTPVMEEDDDDDDDDDDEEEQVTADDQRPQPAASSDAPKAEIKEEPQPPQPANDEQPTKSSGEDSERHKVKQENWDSEF